MGYSKLNFRVMCLLKIQLRKWVDSKFESIPQFGNFCSNFFWVFSWIINDLLLSFNGLVPEAPEHGYSLRFKNNDSSIGKTLIISKT